MEAPMGLFRNRCPRRLFQVSIHISRACPLTPHRAQQALRSLRRGLGSPQRAWSKSSFLAVWWGRELQTKMALSRSHSWSPRSLATSRVPKSPYRQAIPKLIMRTSSLRLPNAIAFALSTATQLKRAGSLRADLGGLRSGEVEVALMTTHASTSHRHERERR